MGWGRFCAALVLSGWTGLAAAQETNPAQPPNAPATTGGPQGGGALRSAVLVMDFETLFANSLFGQRVVQEIEAEGRALIEENERIEAELTAEELLLTSQREEMAPEDFRARADTFDDKVRRLREEQVTKARALGSGREAEELRFRQLVTPIIGRLMRETGALVVIDRGDAIVWAEVIDITPRVLELADRVIGAGAPAPPPTAPAPDPAAPNVSDQ